MVTTLIVEDGSNVANSNSYISLADTVTYFNNKGDQTFIGASQDKQGAALFRAGQAMDAWLIGRWLGRRANAAQSMEWPRKYVIDADGYPVASTVIPKNVKLAQAEIAKIELTTPFIQQAVDQSNAVKETKVGPILVSYKDTAPSITYWPQVIALLSAYATIGVLPINVVIGISLEERRQMDRDRNGHFLNPFDFPDYFHLLKEPIYNPGYDAGFLL